LKILSEFGGTFEGHKSQSFDKLTDYDNFTYELLKLGISYKTKILKRRHQPTQYVVLLINEKEAT